MKRKRSQSRRQSATCSAHGRTETNEVAESSGTKRSRSERGRLQSGLVLRRRSESRPPSTTRVHREEDECPSIGQVSSKSAKKVRILDLVYDDIQEENLRISCVTGGRSLEL